MNQKMLSHPVLEKEQFYLNATVYIQCDMEMEICRRMKDWITFLYL